MWTRRELLQTGGYAALAALAGPGRAAKENGRVTGNSAAPLTGNAMLAAGGNAADAIIAAAFAATVVSPCNTGIGGYGGHAVISTPDGKVTVIDFNSMAPAAARADMFPLDADGKVRGGIDRHGWLAAGVPGIPAGLELVLKRFGTRPLAEVIQPALAFARDGIRLSEEDATGIRNAVPEFSRSPYASQVYLPGGAPPKAGELFKNPDLARVLETFAQRGSVDSFYRGDIAQQIAEAFRKHGGIVTAADLAAYHAREVPALSLIWNGCTVRTAPLTAGSTTMIQALHTLKALDWGREGSGEITARHAQLEALRIAWDDRLKYLGDPEHAKVPLDRLLSERYAQASAERVRAAVRDRKPVAARTDGRPAHGTVHLSAVDGNGMMAALTLTHGGDLGSQVVVDGLGVVLGHGMSRFDPHPDHPNAPGPRKRPMHNMCPTVVLRDGKPVAAVGAAGGRMIVNSVFAVLAQYVGRGASLGSALAAPRLHTEGDLNVLLDPAISEAEEAYFRSLGYTTKRGKQALVNAVGR